MKMHILVIDDDSSILELMKLILEEEGDYQVTLSSPIFKTLIEVEELCPNMIVLDLKMGKAGTGWAFSEKLRAHHSLRNVPLLLYSAAFVDPLPGPYYVSPEYRDIAILRKPFSIDELLQCVRQGLSKNQPTEKGCVY